MRTSLPSFGRVPVDGSCLTERSIATNLLHTATFRLDNCLHGQGAEVLPDIEMAIRCELDQDDADKLFNRIDDEVRSPGATPAETSRRQRLAGLARVHQDRVAESKPVPRPFARDRDAFADVVTDHEIDGLGTEQPDTVVLAALEQHLMELEIV